MVKNLINYGKVTVERGISMKKRCLAVAIFLVVISGVLVFLIAMNPKVPTLKSGKYIYDMGYMINGEDEKVLNNLLREFDSKTDAKLLVVTVLNTRGTIDDYAEKVFDELGMNKLSPLTQHENVLLVFSKMENEVVLKSTSTFDDSLDETRFSRIRSKHFSSNMENGDYDEAVENTTRTVVYAIASKYGAEINNLHFTNLYGNAFLEFGIIFLVLLVCLAGQVIWLNQVGKKKNN